MPGTERVQLTVNGVEYERDVPARMSLADFLREELDLTATHLGCEHGVCGACTVHVDGRTARSCIMLAVQADGAAVTTAEGLARDGVLTPVQRGFWEKHGMQCGFCTPGFLMTVTELLDEHPDPTDEQIADALGANLCRCTGYVKIVEAVHEAARLMREGEKEGWSPGPGAAQPTVGAET
jgi:aerobic-type carbon monoxide dehydrogenase small subunit (CoxS/CutS family)